MANLKGLKISANRRFLEHEDGTPFIWLGDTAWELFHKLGREEADHYLKTRAEQRFNVVQAVALAELDGLGTPNVYGRRPLLVGDSGEYDPSLPDTEEGTYDYWDHVDYIVDTAASYGIYVALLPTWGDKYNPLWGKGPNIFNEENARAYGDWLGGRYSNRSNIVWVLGGDRPLLEYAHFRVIQQMADGIRGRVGDSQLITFHPMGGHSSSAHVHNEDWLDFNMIQSGHGLPAATNYTKVREDYDRLPAKPTLDAEPCYEDHPIAFSADNGYFDHADVRKAAYYALLSGAFGHTYGHHAVWCFSPGQAESLSFEQPGGYVITDWQTAIERPGAWQMRHARALMESRPLGERVPDQSLLAANYNGANYMTAARGERYAFIYSPNGLHMNVQLGLLPGERLTVRWYNPRDGQYQDESVVSNEGVLSIRPPSSGRGEDWVLVLDSIMK